MKTRILASLFAVTLALPLCLASCNKTPSESSESSETYACSCHECVESRRESLEESIAESIADKEAAEQEAAYREFYNSRTQLLKDLLDDDYYNYLIGLMKQNKLVSNSYIAPHPFAFLEDQGHDVASVRAGRLKCKTQVYSKKSEPNNLYMAVYVENAGDYYSEYLLRYTLTSQEMADYNMLFEKRALQSTFINDQISKSKTPEILSEVNIAKSSHDKLVTDEELQTQVERTTKFGVFDIIFRDYDLENQTFTIQVITKQGSSLTGKLENMKTYEMALRVKKGQRVEEINNICSTPYDYTNDCASKNVGEISDIDYHQINIGRYTTEADITISK